MQRGGARREVRGAPREGGQRRGQGVARQDWTCPGCGDLQFARNVQCRRCGAAKPAAAALPTSGQAVPRQAPVPAPAPAAAALPVAQQQDWSCAVCDDFQFARNATCRRCGAAKPTEEAAKIAEARRLREKQTAEKMSATRDWTCTMCDDFQFARNTKCRRCGRPKPTPEAAREYKARKRAEAQAAELARQEYQAQIQAQIQQKADELEAHERRLTAAVWAQARLLLIGACDEASPLSRLPPELVEAIGRWATTRPDCWASSRLAWFKSQARTSPETAVVRVTTYDVDPYGDKPGPENMRGYSLTYHHSRRQPGQAADEPFTIDWWARHGATDTSGFQEYWTEARFLARASYDPEWKRWLSSTYIYVYPNRQDWPRA